MVKTAKLVTRGRSIREVIRELLREILELDDIQAVLTPIRLPLKDVIMPALVHDPAQLETADPLHPSFPLNSAKLASRLTRKPSGARILMVMRPCEIRALFELVKLNQASLEDVVILSVDCPGAIPNRNPEKIHLEGLTVDQEFLESMLNGKEPVPLSSACRICEEFIAQGADIQIGLFGLETNQQLLVNGLTSKGTGLMEQLSLEDWAEPNTRTRMAQQLCAERIRARDDVFARTTEQTNNLEKLGAYLSSCVNCYNCRVACPVCYCRECVFSTDVFDHEPIQYLRWADRKGVVKMPTDTVFYHLTRLAHMSLACVGCGQCSNACPNDIPLMELFRTTSAATQAAFGYRAGSNLDEPPPLSVFKEVEYPEVVGL
jgi:formate dehydrogenase (coenzyme F420) beta subunit